MIEKEAPKSREAAAKGLSASLLNILCKKSAAELNLRRMGFLFLHALVAAVGHDNAASRLGAGGEGGDIGIILQGCVDHVALIGVHGLQRDVSAGLDHLAGDLCGQPLQGFLPLFAVIFRIHVDADPLVLAVVHGVVGVENVDWQKAPMKEYFMELLADSGKATCDYFGKHIVFLNVLRRMSVDCDCAGRSAAEPTIPDIGILASTDILAIDQASCDLVFGMPQKDNHDLVERIQSRHGLRQLSAMAELRMGNPQYELVSID